MNKVFRLDDLAQTIRTVTIHAESVEKLHRLLDAQDQKHHASRSRSATAPEVSSAANQPLRKIEELTLKSGLALGEGSGLSLSEGSAISLSEGLQNVGSELGSADRMPGSSYAPKRNKKPVVHQESKGSAHGDAPISTKVYGREDYYK